MVREAKGRGEGEERKGGEGLSHVKQSKVVRTFSMR